VHQRSLQHDTPNGRASTCARGWVRDSGDLRSVPAGGSPIGGSYGCRGVDVEESVEDDDENACPAMRPTAPPLNAPVRSARRTSTETLSNADLFNNRAYFRLLDMPDLLLRFATIKLQEPISTHSTRKDSHRNVTEP
jgi:hypothetical protein